MVLWNQVSLFSYTCLWSVSFGGWWFYLVTYCSLSLLFWICSPSGKVSFRIIEPGSWVAILCGNHMGMSWLEYVVSVVHSCQDDSKWQGWNPTYQEIEFIVLKVNSFATRRSICCSSCAPAYPMERLMMLHLQMRLSCRVPNSAHPIAFT